LKDEESKKDTSGDARFTQESEISELGKGKGKVMEERTGQTFLAAKKLRPFHQNKNKIESCRERNSGEGEAAKKITVKDP